MGQGTEHTHIDTDMLPEWLVMALQSGESVSLHDLQLAALDHAVRMAPWPGPSFPIYIHHIFGDSLKNIMDGAYAVMPYYAPHDDNDADHEEILAVEFQFGHQVKSTNDLSFCRALVNITKQAPGLVGDIYVDVSRCTSTLGTPDGRSTDLFLQLAIILYAANITRGKVALDQRIDITGDATTGETTVTTGTGADQVSKTFANAGSLYYRLPPLVLSQLP